ncbi:MAG: 4a-hydroxytetrahydrobiopterin dehydratase [Gemmatimonadota bacterium]|nr:4a-hydroxytetrahydrobiopterin dehydratase [Gemmatimonadota bacterium]
MPDLLSDIAIQRELGSLAGWSRKGEVLVKTFQFRSFPDAVAFVNSVADTAESAGHHPDIDIRYARVTLTLSTHDAGGITQNDLQLAKSIEESQARA